MTDTPEHAAHTPTPWSLAALRAGISRTVIIADDPHSATGGFPDEWIEVWRPLPAPPSGRTE